MLKQPTFFGGIFLAAGVLLNMFSDVLLVKVIGAGLILVGVRIVWKNARTKNSLENTESSAALFHGWRDPTVWIGILLLAVLISTIGVAASFSRRGIVSPLALDCVTYSLTAFCLYLSWLFVRWLKKR